MQSYRIIICYPRTGCVYKAFDKIEVLQRIEIESVINQEIELNAPYAAPDFTLRIDMKAKSIVHVKDGKRTELSSSDAWLQPSNTFKKDGKSTQICFDLPKGNSKLILN